MNKVSNLIVGIVALAALIIGGVAYSNSGVSGSQGAQGPQGPRGENGKDGVTTVITKTVAPAQTLGAVTGPDLYSPYFTVNNYKTEYVSRKFNTATSSQIVCSYLIQATSTIESAIAEATSIATTSYSLGIATSTNYVATTSILTSNGIQALVTASGSTTPIVEYVGTSGISASVVKPGQFVNFGVAGPITQGNVTGTCSLKLHVIGVR